MNDDSQSQPTLLQGQTAVAVPSKYVASQLGDYDANSQSSRLELVNTGKPDAGKVDFPGGDTLAASVAHEPAQTNAASSNLQVLSNQVDKSQRNFTALHKLLHGFNPSKQPKGIPRKGPMLTDAQVQHSHAVPAAPDLQAIAWQHHASCVTQNQKPV